MSRGKRTGGRVLRMVLFGGVLFSPLLGWAGVPVVSDVLITDVTDRSFSVVWNANEPSTGSLNLFNGPDCAAPTVGAVIAAHPVLSPNPVTREAVKTAAEGSGILKIQVTGLTPASSYCVQTVTTSKSTLETTLSPATPLTLATQIQITKTRKADTGPDLFPFSNDILSSPVRAQDEVAAVNGGIVAVDLIDLGSHPVTGFVGDGIAAPFSAIDLNNLYDKVSRENINLLGGERIRILEYRGLVGCRLERFRKVPSDFDLAEIKAPSGCFNGADLDCNDTVNILDVLRDVSGFNSAVGDFCFNSDLDLDGNGRVNVLDILSVIGKFGMRR